MKNLIIIGVVFFSFSLSGTVIGQNVYKAAVEDMNAINHDSGVYEIYVNADEITEETIDQSASYYTSYFDVTHSTNEDFRKIMVHLNTPGNQESIHVVKRFLMSMNISHIIYSGSEVDVNSFFRDYMKVESRK